MIDRVGDELPLVLCFDEVADAFGVVEVGVDDLLAVEAGAAGLGGVVRQLPYSDLPVDVAHHHVAVEAVEKHSCHRYFLLCYVLHLGEQLQSVKPVEVDVL